METTKANELEKQFLSYEQSLALEELGFDRETLCGYNREDQEIYLCHMEEDGTTYLPDGDLRAPLFQQAMSFFREKYNLSIEIRGTNFRAGYVIGFPKNINHNSADGFPLVTEWDYVVDNSGVRKTYEEAEEACINKLIELVESTEN